MDESGAISWVLGVLAYLALVGVILRLIGFNRIHRDEAADTDNAGQAVAAGPAENAKAAAASEATTVIIEPNTHERSPSP